MKGKKKRNNTAADGQRGRVIISAPFERDDLAHVGVKARASARSLLSGNIPLKTLSSLVIRERNASFIHVGYTSPPGNCFFN